MAWSLTVAAAVHAAALASWGRLQLPLPPGAALAAAESSRAPEWIFLDEAVSLGLEGSGAAAGPEAATPPASPSRSLTGDVGAVDPSGPDPLRDRLVGATSFAPTLAGHDGTGGVPVPETLSGAAGSGGAGARLSLAEQQLQGLSELDLERLSAVRPEVALEALSYWVLVRNASEVRDFMRSHPSDPADAASGPGTVSVALWVSAEGVVEWAEVITSSGRSRWDDLALELFSQVVLFRPARLEGIAMPISAIFTVNFPWL